MKRKRSVSKKQPSQNPPAQFDVPADGSCLFWATTLAHLIPVKDDEDDFKQRYMDLFGDREIEHISHVKELIQNYNPLLNEVPSDDILKDLVSNTFRNRVVNHIQFHEDKFRDFIFDKFSQYLNDMREPDTWGDQPEIRAMSEMLGAKVTVSGATQSEYGNGNIPIQLFHVSATGEGERNHYNFGLPQSVIDVYNDNVENLPGQQSSAKPKLIELLLTEPINSNSNRGGPVFPINREKPVGFAEKFSLFLDETPNNFGLPQSVIDVYNDNVENLPGQQSSAKPKLIELLLTEPINSNSNRGGPVFPINREKPVGFAEKFSLFLDETPNNFGLPQSVIDVYNDNVENLPGQQSSAKPKLIELLLTEPINSNSNRGGPVFPINREKPVGFAEKFSLFLDETPNNFGLPQSVIDVYNDNVENLPGQQSSAKPKLIELLLTEPINSNSNRGGPVFPINREKPVGFAEKFSLFLDETPNIGSTSKPEFFIHAILGSVLTLPSSGLIEKLGIDKVYVKRTEVDGYKIINNKKVKVTSDVVKLCFSFKKDGKKQVALRVFANDKIKGYKNPEDEYRYSDGELEEIAGKLGISDIDVDEHVFRIRTEGEQGNKSFRLYKGQIDGVKEKFKAAASSPDRTDEFQEVSTDNAVDLGDSFKNLSSKEVGQVIDSTEKIFKELNDVYKNSEKEFSLSNSEAAYHGFVYGALVLNFKYRYGLNCYVERAAGNGRADLILMSRTKDANGRINPKPIPVVVEFKAKNHTASEAIKQIKDKGYLYNLSVRTRAKGAVIVGVNPAQSDALQVEQDEIFQSQNFLRQLLKEMGKFKMKNTLKGELKNLYHLIPSHDQHYLSKVIFGQVLAVEADELDKRIFIYEGEDKSIGEEATTFVLFNQNKAVILNIIEHTQKKTEVDPHGRTRSSQKQGNIFDNNRIPSIDKLGIDSAVKIDVKIRTGEALSSFEVEGDKNKSYYQDINVEEVSNINSRSKYQGKFREIGNINVGSLVTGLEKNPANSGLEYLLSSFKEVLFSHKKLIRKEKDFQAIVQGLLMNGEIKGGKEVRVYTESNISSKGRADLALSFMHFKDDGSFEEGCPIVIELKYAKGIKQVKKALISAKKQLEEKYNLIKSFTSKKTAKSLAMVFNEEAKNTEKLISSSIENFKVKHTTSEDGSSPALTVSSPDKKEEWYSLLPNFFSESVETEVNEEVATTSSRPKSYLNNTSVQGHLTQDRGLRNQGRDLIP